MHEEQKQFFYAMDASSILGWVVINHALVSFVCLTGDCIEVAGEQPGRQNYSRSTGKTIKSTVFYYCPETKSISK
jgi:hypothetical protein